MKQKIFVILLLAASVALNAAPVMADSTMVTGNVPLMTSDVASSAISTSSATISWNTNGNTTSQVFYGASAGNTTGEYTNSTAENSSFVSSHNVTLTSLTAGTTYHYRVRSTIASLVAVSDDLTFATTASSTPPPSGGGGGGGGGGGALTVSGTGTVSWYTSISGIASTNIELKSGDGAVKLTVAAFSTITDGAGHGLGSITCNATATPPPIPPEFNAIAIYDFGPSGATFNPAATITMIYDPSKIPAGVDESTLTLMYWDAAGKQWLQLSNIVVNTETQQISGKTTHFTTFAVFSINPTRHQIVPGTVSLSGSVGADGKVLKTITVKCLESGAPKVLYNATITIREGAVILGKEGYPLTSISMIEMTNPPAWPDKKVIVGMPYDFGPNGATFKAGASLTISYDQSKLMGAVSENDLVIAYYDEAAKKWVEIPISLDKTKHTITAQITHFTAFAVLSIKTAATPPGGFSIIALSVSPMEIVPGQQVTVLATVYNPGDGDATFKMDLLINDAVESTMNANVAAGATRNISFTTTRSVAGVYNVRIGSLTSSFEIKDAPKPVAETGGGINWTTYLSVGLAILGLITLAIAIYARKKGIR